MPADLEDFSSGSGGKESGYNEGDTAQAQAHSALLHPQNLPLIRWQSATNPTPPPPQPTQPGPL